MADSSIPFIGNISSPGGLRRLSLVGVLVAIVVAIGFVGHWASTPSYVTLYSGLDLKEVGAVGDNLAKANIPYRLGASGTDVEVPAPDVARARVALAKSGLPTNGRPGLELFDKPSWGMTDFTQRVTYQRALEGELARTIAQIQGVENAEVHLLLPSTGTLRRQERQAGASVVLQLKGGTPLSPETVQGITYIVSNSVEGLSSENVAVMDNSGRVLSLPSSGLGGTGQTGRQLEVGRGMEQHYADKIENLVGTVVGVGRVRAQVSAVVSFDQVDATIETFNPDAQVLQTEQRSEGQATDGSGSQTVVSNQYQNSRRMEKSTSLAGRLTKLTVAVLVDEKSLRAGERERQLADIDAMVRNAVGIDSTRGDRLSVLSVPFEPVQVTSAGKDSRPKVDPVVMIERISHPLVGVAAIVVMLLVALQIKGALTSTRTARTSRGGQEVRAAEGPSLSQRTGPALEPLPPIEDSQLTKMKHRLQQETTDRPEITAQVLRAWLAEN